MRNGWLLASDSALGNECAVSFCRASGHGGQKVNKTSSAVRLVHRPTGIEARSSESRSQLENRKHAFSRLRMEIAFRVRETPDPAFRIEPPASVHGNSYPLWAACVLDFFEANGWKLSESAAALGVSGSRLARLVFRDPALWRTVLERRAAIGLSPLGTPE